MTRFVVQSDTAVSEPTSKGWIDSGVWPAVAGTWPGFLPDFAALKQPPKPADSVIEATLAPEQRPSTESRIELRLPRTLRRSLVREAKLLAKERSLVEKAEGVVGKLERQAAKTYDKMGFRERRLRPSLCAVTGGDTVLQARYLARRAKATAAEQALAPYKSELESREADFVSRVLSRLSMNDPEARPLENLFTSWRSVIISGRDLVQQVKGVAILSSDAFWLEMWDVFSRSLFPVIGSTVRAFQVTEALCKVQCSYGAFVRSLHDFGERTHDLPSSSLLSSNGIILTAFLDFYSDMMGCSNITSIMQLAAYARADMKLSSFVTALEPLIKRFESGEPDIRRTMVSFCRSLLEK